MPLVWIVLTVLVIAAIGLVSVGRVKARYDELPPAAFFDEQEAVEFIADKLPFEVGAQVSYDDVRRVLGWQLDYLEQKGVAAATEDELQEEQESGSGPLVAEDTESLAYVLGKATEAKLDIEDDHVAAIIDETMAYLAAIGAVGTAVEAPLDPT